MSHEVETAFYSRQPAWHGLGNVLERAPQNYLEALKTGGLDWQVTKEPLHWRFNGFDMDTTKFATVRSTDQRVLGYVGGDYHVLQNEEAMKWCQPLIDTELWTFEAGGSLRQGEFCWTLLKQGEEEVLKGDLLKQYLLLTWNHTGWKSTTIMPCTIRVVCQNTLTAALNEGGERHVVGHYSTMPRKMEEIQRMYLDLSNRFNAQFDLFHRLVDTKWDDGMRETYVKDLFPVSADQAGGKVLERAKARQEMARAFVCGKAASGSKKLQIRTTAYGAYMGATEFSEMYDRPRTDDRGFRILFGDGAVFQKRALDKALALSGITN